MIILFLFFIMFILLMSIQYLIHFNKTIYLKTVDNYFRFSNGENKFE